MLLPNLVASTIDAFDIITRRCRQVDILPNIQNDRVMVVENPYHFLPRALPRNSSTAETSVEDHTYEDIENYRRVEDTQSPADANSQ